MTTFLRILVGVTALLVYPSFLFGQNNTQPTAASFLIIAPDARAGGMGDAGVAVSPDINATFHNLSKLAFYENESGIAASYNPWMQNVSSDMSLSYVTGFMRLNERTALSSSFKYYNMGKVEFTNADRVSLGEFNPKELSLDIGLAKKYGKHFSLGLAFKYIYSNLGTGYKVDGTGTTINAGQSVAADVSWYYVNRAEWMGESEGTSYSFGASISNIGPKMTYLDDQLFLPMNLKVGTAFTFVPLENNELTFAFDVSKLLSPTYPQYAYDSFGNRYITKGVDPNKSIMGALFTSFSDAPGGFKEELQELNYSFGTELLVQKVFALRTGYILQNPNKGNLQAVSLGIGLRYSAFNFDFGYIIPTYAGPFANAMRFSVAFNTSSTPEKHEKN